MNLTQNALLLTHQEFLLEKKRLGSKFKKENYLYLDRQLNEGGALGLVLSLPMILKLGRFAVEKLQEQFRNIPKGRTLHNLFDEDSQEDMITKLDKLGFEDSTGLYKYTKGIYKISHDISHSLDKVSNVERPHLDADADTVKSRLARHKSDPKLMAFLDLLGAIQHGLHHVYQSISDAIAKALLKITGVSYLLRKNPKLESHIVDFLGNVLFFTAVFILLTGGNIGIPNLNFMNAVKACELIAEGCELAGIAITIASSFKSVINKLKTVLSDINIEEIIDGIKTKTAEKLKSLGQAIKRRTSTFKFDPSVLSSKRKIKKDAYAGSDYYGYPVASNESLLIDYIKLLIS